MKMHNNLDQEDYKSGSPWVSILISSGDWFLRYGKI